MPIQDESFGLWGRTGQWRVGTPGIPASDDNYDIDRSLYLWPIQDRNWSNGSTAFAGVEAFLGALSAVAPTYCAGFLTPRISSEAPLGLLQSRKSVAWDLVRLRYAQLLNLSRSIGKFAYGLACEHCRLYHRALFIRDQQSFLNPNPPNAPIVACGEAVMIIVG